MKLRLVVIVAVAMFVTGCAAPLATAYVLSAATVGYSAYGVYELGRDATAEFEIDRNDPDSLAQDKIRKASSIVIYPAADGHDGVYVDIVREVTNLKVISSSKSIAYLKKMKTPNLTSLPESERIGALVKMGKGTRANLVILAIGGHPKVSTGIITSSKVTYPLEVTLLDTKTQQVLWKENEKVVISGLQNMPGVWEVRKVMAAGVAERLMDIRLGREPKAGGENGGFVSAFKCGGKFNPICDSPSEKTNNNIGEGSSES